VGEQPDTVEEVCEPFLVRAGLLARTPRGRVATAGAFRHLGLTPPDRLTFFDRALDSLPPGSGGRADTMGNGSVPARRTRAEPDLPDLFSQEP
jgi:hypothetical protein